MPMKRLMHPDPLQFTHVYSPQEEEALKKNGWLDDDGSHAKVPPDETVQLKPIEPQPEAKPIQPAIVPKKKPGPKAKVKG